MKFLYEILLGFALLQGYVTAGIFDSQVSHSFTTICRNRNGVIMPMPGSCTGFFICIDGYAIASSCGSFYHFNVRTGLCDHPLKAACFTNKELIMDKPTKPNTYQSLPKPKYPIEVVADLNVGPICVNLATGTLLPKSNSCTQYYVCILQRPYRRTCPPMLHFNATRRLCQDPTIARCIKPFEELEQHEIQINRKKINTTAVNNMIASADNDNNKIYNVCATSPDGTFLSYPGDCKRFVLCINRHALTMFCPVGHDYSQQYKRCEWPSIAKCRALL